MSNPTTPLEPQLVTVKEAARFLCISERKLHDLPIPRVRIGRAVRFDVADLRAWIVAQKDGAR